MTQEKKLFILFLCVWLPAVVCRGIDSRKADAFAGQDLHLAGRQVLSYQLSSDEHTLVFEDGFSMSIGSEQFSSEKAVVRLKARRVEFRGKVRIDYDAGVYLEGQVTVQKAKDTLSIGMSRQVVQEGVSEVLRFSVGGEVFVTADKRQVSDPSELELYKRAENLTVPVGPAFVIQPGAIVPSWPPEEPVVVEAKPVKPLRKVKPAKRPEIAAEPKAKEPLFVYPVNISPATEKPLEIEKQQLPDGLSVATVTERFYLWQKQDEKGRLLELQADSAVVFYSEQSLTTNEDADSEDVLAKGAIKAVYLEGGVLMTEGPRTVRCDRMYYDFRQKKALAENVVMRNFDTARGIPVYVRAARLRQLAENKFAAEDVTLTSSEFYQPQISMTASSVVIVDTTPVDAQQKSVTDSSFDALMRDVSLNVGQKTLLRWPKIRSNLQRPDVPFKRAHLGHDNILGTSLETQWYFSRILGLREPKGVESTLLADYYSKRGVGAGAQIDYTKDTYFGNISSYIIKDSGEDELGRDSSRENLDPGNDLRGRFSWLHRHFLPYNWQFTSAINYISDENFLEAFYRSEFNTGPAHETYVHLKRTEKNWALSFLANARLNDFSDQLEELPGGQFHLTGQSLFDDRFTLYSDTDISRLRQRIGDRHATVIDEDIFSFARHRTELDMPVSKGSLKIVPYGAVTFAYDDRSGFTRTLVDGTNTGRPGDDQVWIAEAGIRIFPNSLWKVYPNINWRIWDVNQLRHIISPRLTAAVYEQDALAVRQRDILSLGLSQRLQTKRGRGEKQRTVDWMKLDTEVSWVDNSGSASSGPDRLSWARPFIPMRVFSAPDIFNGDLSAAKALPRFEFFGPRRNYFAADYIWRISDTTALLSDMNFDMQSGVVGQFNIGLSRLAWPNLQFYIGSRYLRRVNVINEQGSNALTFAATYVLDPRYTLVFAQQFDFDYGANIRSDITLIRKYHRIHYGFTYSADGSLDRQAIVFSIWPQGIKEMAIGQRRYIGLGGSAGY